MEERRISQKDKELDEIWQKQDINEKGKWMTEEQIVKLIQD